MTISIAACDENLGCDNKSLVYIMSQHPSPTPTPTNNPPKSLGECDEILNHLLQTSLEEYSKQIDQWFYKVIQLPSQTLKSSFEMFKTGFSVASKIPYQITMIWCSYKCRITSKVLTHKGLEMHGRIFSTVATDAKAPGHQYPQCSQNSHCIGSVLGKNIRLIMNNTGK